MAFEGPPGGGNGILEIHPDGLGEVVHLYLRAVRAIRIGSSPGSLASQGGYPA
jgi:hypothetical protein